MPRLRAILAGLFFVAGLLFCLRGWLDVRFSNRVARALPNLKTTRPALTNRVVLFLFDDTGYPAAERNLTGIFGKARQEGWVGRVTLDRYTFTIAGVYTLGTGDQPSLLQIKDDFGTRPVAIDSIFGAVRRGGGRTAVFGEVLWEDLFQAHVDFAFTRRDLGPFIEYGSEQMLAKFEESLSKREARLTVVHLGETGHLNHKVGVNGGPIRTLLAALDRRLLDIIQRHGTDTTWLIGGDHGTTSEGQHGGETTAERTTFLAAFGPGIAKLGTASLSQPDIPNIVSVLTGSPLVSQGCGLIPMVFPKEAQATIAAANSELLLQKRALYRGLVEQYGFDGSVDESDTRALKRAIDHRKLNAGSARELGGPVLLLLGAIGLLVLSGGPARRPRSAVVVLLAGLAALALPARSLLFVGGPFLAIVAGMAAPRVREMPRRLVAWVAALLAFAVPTLFFYFYPSQIYLRQTETVRYVWLAALLVPIALAFLSAPTVARHVSRAARKWHSAALWALGAAVLVSMEMRYYQTFVPLGLLLLYGLAVLRKGRERSSRRSAWCQIVAFGIGLLALPYAFLCGIEHEFLDGLRQAFRQSNWQSEVALAVALVVAARATWGYYRGHLGPTLRVLAWVGVLVAHGAFHLRLAPTNATLIAAFAGGFGILVLGLLRDLPQSRPYWFFVATLLLSSQQQSALLVVLSLVGALVFRWFVANNPYPSTTWRQRAFLAYVTVCYFFTFMAAKGHKIRPAHVEILRGFIGYEMPLIVPLNVGLVCFYYLQPLWIAWMLVRLTVPDAPTFASTGRVVTSIALGQVLFTVLLLSFSTVPGDTYQKSLAGAILSLILAVGSVLAQSVGRRESVLPKADGAAIV